MSRPIEHGYFDKLDRVVLIECPRRRRSRAWLSHVGPAIGIAAGIGMWAAAVVWLLVRVAS